MLSSLTLAHWTRPRLPSRLLAVMLTVMAALAPGVLKAQTTNSPEISSRDVEPTFKLQSERSLVMVHVVVRDAKGATVDNLRQEDFQLLDQGKLQTILHFSLEKPVLKAPEPPTQKSAEKAAAAPEAGEETATPAFAARRFVALYFDDVNTPFENLVRARDATDRFLPKSIQPGDRFALYTSSGQKQIDFTDDLAQIHQALLDLRPRPITEEDTSCGAIPPHEAYLIVENQDPIAIQVATNEIMNCKTCPPGDQLECNDASRSMVHEEAVHSLEMSETQSRAALQGIESVVRHMMMSLPGQRSVVIISGGFLTERLHFELGQIADRALRGGVVVNAVDARGLYTDPAIPKASEVSISSSPDGAIIGQKGMMLRESAGMQTDGMESLALDTGGIFFNNSNDLEAGLRKAAGPPEAFYVLAFSPQNLKNDGAFHPLQVKLGSPQGLTVQARRGYFAPKKADDPAAQEKEEIREAVFSQDETHELPIDLHTQFFMKTESEAHVTVLMRLDVHPLHFRKEADRNVANLTVVTVMFDRDGHLISGHQKSVEMRVSDAGLEALLKTGATIRSLFDVKPGNYLLRAVVRDSASGQISGVNRTVEIPQ